jgi:hypothetical protein
MWWWAREATEIHECSHMEDYDLEAKRLWRQGLKSRFEKEMEDAVNPDNLDRDAFQRKAEDLLREALEEPLMKLTPDEGKAYGTALTRFEAAAVKVEAAFRPADKTPDKEGPVARGRAPTPFVEACARDAATR